MMTPVTFFTWLPVITMLLLLPIACIQDYNRREIDPKVFGVYFIINAPVLLYMYYTGAYGIEEGIVSVLPVAILYFIMRFSPTADYFHGDDFILLSLISIFCIINPLDPRSGALGVTTIIYLCGVLFALFCLLYVRELAKSAANPSEGKNFIGIMLSTGKNYPMVVPISVAFVLALIL